MKQNMHVFSTPDSLCQDLADFVVKLARKSIKKRGNFSIALSGGSTPRPLYHVLGSINFQGQIDWHFIHLFWGDERNVPPEHPESNFGMTQKILIEKIPIPEENVHRVPAEMDVRMAAFSYEETLRRFFNSDWPRFDLVLLGMGEDGHTASLFPQSAGLNEEHRWFIANHAPERNVWRLTLTKNAINAARQIVVIVTGASKSDMLVDVIEGEYDPESKPIQLIKPTKGKMTWFVDQSAARKLSR